MNSSWIKAEELARAMGKDKTLGHRTIARKLNALGLTTRGGAAWSGNEVKRLLAKPAKQIPASWRDPLDETLPPEDGEEITEPTWQQMVAQYEATMKYMRDRDNGPPEDWRRPVTWHKLGTATLFERLGLAGKDTWSEHILPLVVQQTLNTSKPIMELLDGIKTDAATKGQLRRLVFGIMRELAMSRETILALRKQLGQPEPSIVPLKPREKTVEELEAEVRLMNLREELNTSHKPGWRER